MGNYTIFRCSKILGEECKKEILQQMFQKFWISNRLPNIYFPKIDIACPWTIETTCNWRQGAVTSSRDWGWRFSQATMRVTHGYFHRKQFYMYISVKFPTYMYSTSCIYLETWNLTDILEIIIEAIFLLNKKIVLLTSIFLGYTVLIQLYISILTG